MKKLSIAEARANIEAAANAVLPESQWAGERPTPAPPALIKGLMPETGVGMYGGQSGAGKTFSAIDMGAHLIPDCNKKFYIDRYRIKRHGGVLYQVLEGKGAFPLRLTAALETLLDRQMEFGERAKLPFAWNYYVPDLYGKNADALIKLAEREAKKMREDFGVDLVAIFLDTMGLAACYEDEDRSAQVQKVISELDRLSSATGAVVIGVDHYGKNQSAGLRGSSAKRGHIETLLSCRVDRDDEERPINHRLVLEKIRDGADEGRVIPYRLEQVNLGRDQDGDPLSTCVIEWEFDRPPPKKKQRREPKRDKTSVILELAINETKLPVKTEVLRAAFYKHHGGTRHAANAAWNRAIELSDLKPNLEGDEFDRPI